MILSRAPLRVSFFGGSTDIPAFYRKHGGATISMAINKYVYVALMPTPHKHIKVSYSKQETVNNVNDIQNDIVRECLKKYGITSGIEITTFADIPTVGTGLGGSSAFACALIAALNAYYGVASTPYDIANSACDIEINRCGWNIGKQDQFASAFGGFNFIEYLQDDSVLVTKLNQYVLDEHCILIPVDGSRSASEIISTIDFKSKEDSLLELLSITHQMKRRTPDAEEYGLKLREAWDLKKKTSDSISNQEIDIVVESALPYSYGCKLLGAGGSGYVLAIRNNWRFKLSDVFKNKTLLTFNEAVEGAKVIFDDTK